MSLQYTIKAMTLKIVKDHYFYPFLSSKTLLSLLSQLINNAHHSFAAIFVDFKICTHCLPADFWERDNAFIFKKVHQYEREKFRKFDFV